MKYLSIDPGGTSGWAAYDDTLATTPMQGVSKGFQVGHLGPGWHGLDLYNLILLREPHLTIVEAFNYQRREVGRGVSLNLDAKEYIGICKLFCVKHRTEYLEYQPGQAKKLVNDNWLRSLGLWNPEFAPHGMDALRQLVYHLVTKLNRHDLVPKPV